MFLIIGLVLIALWLMGFVVFPVLGWLIHILLIAAVISILIRIIRGK